jgi:hypothetical protein
LKRLFADQLVVYLDLVRDISGATDGLLADAPNRSNWIKRLEELQPTIRELELDASGTALDRLIGALRQPEVNPEHADLIRQFAGSFRQVFVDQMAHRRFLMLLPSQDRLYEDVKSFGEDVAIAFPSAGYDIEEATKCLALERATACVFHLMRIMEICLRVVAASLKDPRVDPASNPNWGVMLKRFDEELAKPLAKRSPDWAADDAFYSGVAAQLRAVKDAWRNKTIHVSQTYDPARAEDVFTHVRAFTRQVAVKLHE